LTETFKTKTVGKTKTLEVLFRNQACFETSNHWQQGQWRIQAVRVAGEWRLRAPEILAEPIGAASEQQSKIVLWTVYAQTVTYLRI